MWLIITLIIYFIARWFNHKSKSALSNPLLLSIAFIIALLFATETSLEIYVKDTHWLNILIQPAIVAFAYPLYQQLSQIKTNWRIIFFSCTVGSVMSMLSASFIAIYLDVDSTLVASILTKSVTTPIAMEISRTLGGEAAVAAILVLIAGLFGAIFAYPIYGLLNITHPIARGLTMGTISHALGTAACIEKNSSDAAFSALALVICGIITSLIAPLAYFLVTYFY